MSLAVDGSGQNFTVPFPAIPGNYSLSFWVKVLNTSGSFNAMLDDTATIWRMLFDFHGVNSGFNGNLMPGPGFDLSDDDNWHHVVVTRDNFGTGNQFKGYIDSSNTYTNSNATTGAAATVHFGDNPSGGGANFKGKYADVRVYSAALSPTDVANLFAGTDVTANLVRHWPLTEGSGTTLGDTGGGGQNGSSAGGATWDADIPSALSGGGDTTPPIVASANVNAAGTTLTIAFTEAGSAPVLPASSATGFTLNATGGAVTLSSTAISGTTFTATTSRTIHLGETLTLDYAPGNVTDSAGSPNAMAGFSGTSVTNNSTQTGPLAAGAVSFVSSGPAGIVMSATDATAGTPSYTYQWKRNTDGGSYSNLSNGGGVSGATTRNLTDDSAVAGHLYGYELAYTDSAGSPATVTATPVTASVYTGGALAGGGAILSRSFTGF